MKRSTDRIITTHAGSLVRTPEIVSVMRKDRGEPYDHEAFVTRVREATREVVRQQADCGIDVVADGELGKTGFNNYTNERLSGFERRPGAPGITARGTRRDQELFPRVLRGVLGLAGRLRGAVGLRRANQVRLDRDRAGEPRQPEGGARGRRRRRAVDDGVSPPIMTTSARNEYYASETTSSSPSPTR